MPALFLVSSLPPRCSSILLALPIFICPANYFPRFGLFEILYLFLNFELFLAWACRSSSNSASWTHLTVIIKMSWLMWKANYVQKQFFMKVHVAISLSGSISLICLLWLQYLPYSFIMQFCMPCHVFHLSSRKTKLGIFLVADKRLCTLSCPLVRQSHNIFEL